MIIWRWRPSMVITRKDFTDAWHNLLYYVKQKPAPARCDRYDYRGKFEY